jgi:hypothetical protein
MAITRTQIAKQLLEYGGRVGLQGGGADMGDPGRSQERADRGYGDPGGGLAAGENTPSQDRIRDIRQANITLENLRKDKEFEQQGFETLRVKDSNFPGFLSIGLNLLKGPRQKALDYNIDFFRNDPRTKRAREKYGLTAQGYKNYMSDRQKGTIDAAGNLLYQDDDDNDAYIFPRSGIMAEAPSDTDQEPEQEDSEEEGLRLAFRADGGRAGLAEGGMPYEGGIMDLESARQMYGLGKLVKKVTRSVKKIAKSPIGKAALLYTGAAMAGSFGGTGSLFSKGMFNPGNIGRGIFGITAKGQALRGFPELAAKKGLLGKIGLTGGYGSIMPTAMGAIAGTSLLSGFLTKEQEEEAQLIADSTGIDIEEIRANPDKYLGRRFKAEGGSMDEPVAKKTMPLLDMGGKEMDLRAEGGFVPIGRMEKADDVPARLSKNEFVFTAEAVRNAGEGDVDKGAEVMYNMMKNLESGGDVSEESQGLDGARKMFQTSQRLEEVL